MNRLDEAKQILESLQVPLRQQNKMCCLVLLAMASIKKRSRWCHAENNWIGIHDIIAFANKNYQATYAENSRETFRKLALHHFRTAAIVEDNGCATNSPSYKYRLTNETLNLIRSFKTAEWKNNLSEFQKNHQALIKIYSSDRKMRRIPVKVNGTDLFLSTGKHNQLQKAVIEEFASRFAPDSKCLYIGDTTDKNLYKDEQTLSELKFEITLHDKMPDVVLYSPQKNWLYFIEAVTSVGSMEPKRILEIKELTANTHAFPIYVTAFPDFKTYKKFSESLAWETEVWIAEMPDHMIHLNGDKFLGPRKNKTI